MLYVYKYMQIILFLEAPSVHVQSDLFIFNDTDLVSQ